MLTNCIPYLHTDTKSRPHSIKIWSSLAANTVLHYLYYILTPVNSNPSLDFIILDFKISMIAVKKYKLSL